MAQIKRIGILQTSKFAAVFYFIITFIIFLPFGLIMMFIPGAMSPENQGLSFLTGFLGGMTALLIIIFPLLYAIIGGVMVALMSLMYNLTAKIAGGIEINLDEENLSKQEFTPYEAQYIKKQPPPAPVDDSPIPLEPDKKTK